jgi:hypothetical protein
MPPGFFSETKLQTGRPPAFSVPRCGPCGRIHPPRRHKIPPESVYAIRARLLRGESPIAIAGEFGVHPASIERIRKITKCELNCWVVEFWLRVEKIENGCWIWKKQTDEFGYGKFQLRTEYKSKLAHRISMSLHLDRILLPSENVLHNCPGGDNPACVNPAHLLIGSMADNNRDMINKGRFRHHGGFPGVTNPAAKLSENQVRKIRKRFARGCSVSQLSRGFGICRKTIDQILQRITWGHVE